MGNRINTLSWSWPLISYEWLPEILKSLENLLEPSWIGLEREMTREVPNPKTGRHAFRQLRKLLEEMSLIREAGRFIETAVEPDRICVVNHFRGRYQDSSAGWANYFRQIDESKEKIHFGDFDSNKPKSWEQIAKYSVFKQWTGYFQFIGYGFRISNDLFIPDSAITEEMCHDQKFIEQCIKASWDLRLLTGKYSLNTEADYLAWTKGEESLSISKDPNLSPRIAHDKIIKECRLNGLNHALKQVLPNWHGTIYSILEQHSFPDLHKTILTCKQLLDYFIFGQLNLTQDNLTKENINNIKNIWKSVPHFKIKGTVWNSLPSLYKSVTRLSLGCLYFRNSLRKLIKLESNFDESILYNLKLENIRNQPVRCFRLSKTLYSILEPIIDIGITLSRLSKARVHDKLEEQIVSLYETSSNFLPTCKIDLSETLRELEKLVEIDDSTKVFLNKYIPTSNPINYAPTNELLRTCYWVHLLNQYNYDQIIISIKSLQSKLDAKKNLLLREIKDLESAPVLWENAYSDFKKKLKEIEGRLV